MATDKLVDFDHVTDYISREAAYSIFKNSCDECKDFCLEFDGIYPDCDSCLMGKAKRQMLDIPASDVRPVVKASWKKDNSYPGPGLMNLRCSVCGEFGGTWKDSTLPSMLYNFCPNCGADMRESNLDTTKGERA